MLKQKNTKDTYREIGDQYIIKYPLKANKLAFLTLTFETLTPFKRQENLKVFCFYLAPVLIMANHCLEYVMFFSHKI